VFEWCWLQPMQLMSPHDIYRTHTSSKSCMVAIATACVTYSKLARIVLSMSNNLLQLSSLQITNVMWENPPIFGQDTLKDLTSSKAVAIVHLINLSS